MLSLRSDRQEIDCLLWSTIIYYLVRKSPTAVHILRQMDAQTPSMFF